MKEILYYTVEKNGTRGSELLDVITLYIVDKAGEVKRLTEIDNAIGEGEENVIRCYLEEYKSKYKKFEIRQL